jgi:DNA invertase Pin-like site-specific DNA recombinase
MLQEIEIRNAEDIQLNKDILTLKDGVPHVGGYIRTATIDAVGNYSPDEQRSAVRDFCKRKFPEGCRLFWISDIGASGKLPWKHDNLQTGQYRPGLTILVDLIKQGSVWNICTYGIDRLARSTRILFELLEDYIEPYSTRLYSVTEIIDAKKYNDILAAQEIHRLCSMQRIAADAQQARIREGYTVGRPPYGWISEDVRILKHSQRVGIEPVAAETEIVRRIVNEYLNGHCLSQIASGLASSNVLSPGGTNKWSSKTVKGILRCPIHYGLMKSIDGTLVRGVHYDKRLFDESVYEQVVNKNNRKG